MAAISRREFFKKTATDAAVAGFLAAGAGATLRANPLGLPIGSQTYPHRAMIKDGNFAGHRRPGVEALCQTTPTTPRSRPHGGDT